MTKWYFFLLRKWLWQQADQLKINFSLPANSICGSIRQSIINIHTTTDTLHTMHRTRSLHGALVLPSTHTGAPSGHLVPLQWAAAQPLLLLRLHLTIIYAAYGSVGRAFKWILISQLLLPPSCIVTFSPQGPTKGALSLHHIGWWTVAIGRHPVPHRRWLPL